MMFIGRQEELAELNNLYFTDKFQCVIIYGRRRVGKTTLISEFVKGKQALFFAATENNSDSMREEFCNRMYQALNAHSIGTLDSWQSVRPWSLVAGEPKLLSINPPTKSSVKAMTPMVKTVGSKCTSFKVPG